MFTVAYTVNGRSVTWRELTIGDLRAALRRAVKRGLFDSVIFEDARAEWFRRTGKEFAS